MKKSKQARLKAAGWKVGTVRSFLGLSAADAAFIEMKLALAMELKRRRKQSRLTQHDVASLVASSQSRVAKMEAADDLVSIDLLVRALLALGATRRDIARVLGARAA